PQFTEGNHLVIMKFHTGSWGILQDSLQRRELTLELSPRSLLSGCHFKQNGPMFPLKRLHHVGGRSTIQPGPCDVLQGVGCLTHRAHYDHEIVQCIALHHLRHIANAFRILYACTTELEDLHPSASFTNCALFKRPFTHCSSSSAPNRL